MSGSVRSLTASAGSRALVVPEHVDTVLASGLRVLAIRRPGAALVEIRLRIPFAGVDLARAWLLARTLFSGAARRPAQEFAETVRRVGGRVELVGVIGRPNPQERGEDDPLRPRHVDDGIIW